MEKNFSPVLTGVMIRTKQYADGWKLVFVGTDSFRLAEYKIAQMQNVPGAYTIIIPKVHVQDIKKVAEYAESKKIDQMKLWIEDQCHKAGIKGSVIIASDFKSTSEHVLSIAKKNKIDFIEFGCFMRIDNPENLT